MTNQTDLNQFPVPIHHLVRYAIEGEDRKLYNVGIIGYSFYTKIKENQVRKSPYEIADIEVGERFGFRVHYTDYKKKKWENREIVCRIDFKNKQTLETGEHYLIDGEWADLLTGLEGKLGANVRPDVQEDLKIFKGIEVTGVAIEHASEERRKYNHLIGIFI